MRIPIVDIFEIKRTDIALVSGTLKEVQDLASKLNPEHLVIARIESDKNQYELFVRIKVSYHIEVNGKKVISDDLISDLIVID